jgi:hypothetical protein
VRTLGPPRRFPGEPVWRNSVPADRLAVDVQRDRADLLARGDTTSHVIIVKEIGVGIALAVLNDASIVRALLVPSLMAILGRRNWWPSARACRR